MLLQREELSRGRVAWHGSEIHSVYHRWLKMK